MTESPRSESFPPAPPLWQTIDRPLHRNGGGDAQDTGDAGNGAARVRCSPPPMYSPAAMPRATLTEGSSTLLALSPSHPPPPPLSLRLGSTHVGAPPMMYHSYASPTKVPTALSLNRRHSGPAPPQLYSPFSSSSTATSSPEVLRPVSNYSSGAFVAGRSSSSTGGWGTISTSGSSSNETPSPTMDCSLSSSSSTGSNHSFSSDDEGGVIVETPRPNAQFPTSTTPRDPPLSTSTMARSPYHPSLPSAPHGPMASTPTMAPMLSRVSGLSQSERTCKTRSTTSTESLWSSPSPIKPAMFSSVVTFPRSSSAPGMVMPGPHRRRLSTTTTTSNTACSHHATTLTSPWSTSSTSSSAHSAPPSGGGHKPSTTTTTNYSTTPHYSSFQYPPRKPTRGWRTWALLRVSFFVALAALVFAYSLVVSGVGGEAGIVLLSSPVAALLYRIRDHTMRVEEDGARVNSWSQFLSWTRDAAADNDDRVVTKHWNEELSRTKMELEAHYEESLMEQHELVHTLRHEQEELTRRYQSQLQSLQHELQQQQQRHTLSATAVISSVDTSVLARSLAQMAQHTIYDRFGKGPYFVEFEIETTEKRFISENDESELVALRYITMETTSVVQSPLVVYTILEQVAHELLDNVPLHFAIDPHDIGRTIIHANAPVMATSDHPYRQLITSLDERRNQEPPLPTFYTMAYRGVGPAFDVSRADRRDMNRVETEESTIFGRVVAGRNSVDELLAIHGHTDPTLTCSSRIRSARFLPQLTEAANELYQIIVAHEGVLQ